jgi:hypothetical protein
VVWHWFIFLSLAGVALTRRRENAKLAAEVATHLIAQDAWGALAMALTAGVGALFGATM